jgi:hypothetical protein
VFGIDPTSPLFIAVFMVAVFLLAGGWALFRPRGGRGLTSAATSAVRRFRRAWRPSGESRPVQPACPLTWTVAQRTHLGGRNGM